MSTRFPGLIPNRYGTTTEYKKGTLYLSHTVWDDGHEEIEIHRCSPEQIFHTYDVTEQGLPSPKKVGHTCDSKQFDEIFAKFAALEGETIDLDNEETLAHKAYMIASKIKGKSETNEMSSEAPSVSDPVQKD